MIIENKSKLKEHFSLIDRNNSKKISRSKLRMMNNRNVFVVK